MRDARMEDIPVDQRPWFNYTRSMSMNLVDSISRFDRAGR